MIPGRGKPRLPEPPIELSKVLLVEGRDAVEFFEALLVEMGLSSEIELRNMGGVQELRSNLKALRDMASFKERVTSLGIVRDAEAKGVSAAFQSVQGALKASELGVPDHPNTTISGQTSISVYILPDCQTSGMLEDLCVKALDDAIVMQCVEEYLSCLPDAKRDQLNIAKATVHSFLSAQKEPGLLLGQAAHRKYLNLQSPAYDSLKLFLQNI